MMATKKMKQKSKEKSCSNGCEVDLPVAECKSESDLVAALFVGDKNSVLDKISARLHKPFSLVNISETYHLINLYGEKEQKCNLEGGTVGDINRLATVAIEMASRLQTINPESYREIIGYYSPLTAKFGNICRNMPIQCFDSSRHVKTTEKTSALKAFFEHFERVNVTGDGTSVWDAVSMALFGDSRACAALRLLTAATLTEFEKEFRVLIDEQETKSGKAEVTYDQLLTTITQVDVSFQDCHLLAISAAIGKPIYCYPSNPSEFSSSDCNESLHSSDADDFANDIAKKLYEEVDSFGHKRFLAFEVDDSEDPVGLCVDDDQFSAVLPKSDNVVQLWKPKDLVGFIVCKNTKLNKESNNSFSDQALVDTCLTELVEMRIEESLKQQEKTSIQKPPPKPPRRFLKETFKNQ